MFLLEIEMFVHLGLIFRIIISQISKNYFHQRFACIFRIIWNYYFFQIISKRRIFRSLQCTISYVSIMNYPIPWDVAFVRYFWKNEYSILSSLGCFIFEHRINFDPTRQHVCRMQVFKCNKYYCLFPSIWSIRFLRHNCH